jgi:hypothetical protein
MLETPKEGSEGDIEFAIRKPVAVSTNRTA